MTLYHPNFERFFDVKTKTQFSPEKLPTVADNKVFAVAEVKDKDALKDLKRRGFLEVPKTKAEPEKTEG